MKKKVGILTFHQAINYGAVLQAYALKEVCNELGYEAHIINYANTDADSCPHPFSTLRNSGFNKSALIKYVRSLTSYFGDRKKWQLFCEFRKNYLEESKLCKTAEEIADLDYDAYIAGSDQIWNYKITGNTFDSIFFGGLKDKATKVIYAASSHDTPFPLDKELDFIDNLKTLPTAVSIREEKLADYVYDLINVRYPIVLDPTLLAGRNILDQLPDVAIPQKRYILIYQIDSNPASDISVKSLEKRFQCDVYTMTVPRIGSIHGRKGVANPEKFLSLLKGAEFLVTNSFHGIALSLIFEKQFFVYENGGVMSRIDGLLDTLNLNDRKVKMTADIIPENVIDYLPIRKKLDVLRNESREFLIKALNQTFQLPKYEKVKKQIKPLNQRKKKDCSGCSACAEICPVNAISMIADQEGFKYPFIDEEKCIHCGKCDHVCGFTPVAEKTDSFKLPKAFGVKHNDERIRMNSRSGGAFVAFSDLILNQGGAVYGAVMQKDFTVKHSRAFNETQRNKMTKAKYVESDIVGIFPQVEKDLISGKAVLFSGTPCQVSGLQAYLREKKISDEKLYCCDLICHGVPSPKIWDSYLKYVEEENGKKIIEANFRDKEFGWDSHCESFIFQGKDKKYVSRDYTDLFYQHIMFRPSCYNCKFANIHRPGDATLGDFWGIEKNDPAFDDNKGVSLILVNTEKGNKLFNMAKENVNVIVCDIRNCIQPTLVKPSSVSPRRDEFWDDYEKMVFCTFLKKYTTPLVFQQRIKKNLKEIMYQVGLRSHP